MAKQAINLGTAPAGSDGDTVRAAMVKINANFDEVYARLVSRLAKSVAGSGSVTLTAAEVQAVSMGFSGALTGNKTVVFPVDGGAWLVKNLTTGAFTLTLKTAAQVGGIVLPQGAVDMVYFDGTNLVSTVEQCAKATDAKIANSVEVSGVAPALLLTETDQATPAGRWRIVTEGAVLSIGRLTAAPGTYSNVLSVAANGAVTLSAATTVSGVFTATKSLICSANTSDGGPFHATGEIGNGFANWTASAQPALQVDTYDNGAAYMGLRWTKWGDRHIAAIHAYAGGTAATTPDISFAIGTLSRAAVFDGLGRAYATSFNPTSDARLKRNVEPILDSGAKLDQLTGCTWERIDLLDDGNRRYAGVIAQALQEVLPEAVSESDQFLSVDPMGVIALLVNAMKDARQALADLQARVESLEGTGP